MLTVNLAVNRHRILVLALGCILVAVLVAYIEAPSTCCDGSTSEVEDTTDLSLNLVYTRRIRVRVLPSL